MTFRLFSPTVFFWFDRGQEGGDVSTEDELLEQQIRLEHELEIVRRQIADLAAAAELFEEGPVIPIADERLSALIQELSLGPLIGAIAVFNADWLLDASTVIDSARSELAGKIAQLTAELEALRSRPPQTQPADDQTVEQAVNTRLEGRLRALSHDLYERTLALPRRLRETVAAFSEERAAFQRAMNDRRRAIDSLLSADPPIDAALGVAVAKAARIGVFDRDRSDLHELCRKIQDVQIRVGQIEERASANAQEASRRRGEYRALIDQADDLQHRAEELERLATLFGIPCPPEVARQLQETKSRLLLSEDGTSDRAADMLRFQPSIPEPPEALVQLFDARIEASALIMRLEANPAHLFVDAISRSTALERLFVLLALLTAQDKGYGKKTYLSILRNTGLVPDDDLEEFEETVDRLLESDLFETERYKRGYVHKPTDACRRAAQATLQFARDPRALESALEYGKKQHWVAWREARYGRTSNGPDSDDS